MGISRRYWIGLAGLFALITGILLAMHRPLICTCGTIKLWEGVVNGPGNSQHISDWYSFSHVIHGFLFFGLTFGLLRRFSLGARAMIAAALELSWEVLENSPMIIDRYRQATMAVGYSGDSILNSLSDGGWMVIGFLAASRLPWKVTVALAIGFELFTLVMIRDNLTLNIVMLVAPLDAIRQWQAGL
ncbi:MAG: hypothetical protein RIS52_128 [Pseudomonadota bacterium]|jgi:hypothetical protein